MLKECGTTALAVYIHMIRTLRNNLSSVPRYRSGIDANHIFTYLTAYRYRAAVRWAQPAWLKRQQKNDTTEQQAEAKPAVEALAEGAVVELFEAEQAGADRSEIHRLKRC